MNIIKRDPFFSLIDDLTKENYTMKSDIYEKDGNYIIEADVPGFKKEDIDLAYNNGYITISAKKEEIIEENSNYIRRERHYGEFKRSYYVGSIDESKIDAELEAGTLKITLPKESITNKKSIAIK